MSNSPAIPRAARFRLSALSFLQFAIFGTWLTSVGVYLSSLGMGRHIGMFYATQGLVSLFMPALMGFVADRWIAPRLMLALCHVLSAAAMAGVCVCGLAAGGSAEPGLLYGLFAVGVAFYMPTIALCHSVSFRLLEERGADPMKSFPPIRMWGTVGFIASMWVTDLCGWQPSPMQFGFCAALGLAMAAYCLSLPRSREAAARRARRLSDAFGLEAFSLMRQGRMAVFFLFSALVGACMQIANGFATPFVSSFGSMEEYAGCFGVEHPGILVSVSQMSETACVLAIPFFLRRFGIRVLLATAIGAWMLRFGLLALGNPGEGLWLWLLSMVMYGFAFDFFNIGGALFINSRAAHGVRNAAQGLFMMMTNGVGSMVGMLIAQEVVSHRVYSLPASATGREVMHGWQASWLIFAAYALAVGLAFVLVTSREKRVRG